MRIFAFCLLTFAFCLATACRPAAAPVSVANRPSSINDRPTTNQPMPPLKDVENLGWTRFEGGNETLGSLKGKVVVLDFWATYCPPCIEEIPHLRELQKKYGADLQIVGLHVGGDEDKPKVPAFVEKLNIDYALGYPEDELMRTLLGNDNSIPQTAVFDRDGKLVTKLVGFDNIVKMQLDDAIENSIKGNN